MTKKRETFEMARLYRGGKTMRQIGECYEISRQTVQQRLASIGITGNARPPKYMLIDKDRLEFLYASERLSIDKIGEVLGAASHLIEQALKFHRIPKRTSISTNGKYVDVLRLLEIEAAAEIECPAKHPHKVLHKSAKCAGTKISVKKLDHGKYQVTRIS